MLSGRLSGASLSVYPVKLALRRKARGIASIENCYDWPKTSPSRNTHTSALAPVSRVFGSRERAKKLQKQLKTAKKHLLEHPNGLEVTLEKLHCGLLWIFGALP